MPILTKQQIAAITELTKQGVETSTGYRRMEHVQGAGDVPNHISYDPHRDQCVQDAEAGLENLEFTAELAERGVEAVSICNQLMEQAMRVMEVQETKLKKLATVRTAICAFIFFCGAVVGAHLAVTIGAMQ